MKGRALKPPRHPVVTVVPMLNVVNEATSAQKAGVSKPRRVEDAVWTSADKLRTNMDTAECKHVALGLIYLKYISALM